MINVKNKTKVEQPLDRVAQQLMVKHLVWAKYTEWQELDRRMFRAMVDQTVPFSDEDRIRMDALWSDIIDIFFRVVDEMRKRGMDLSDLSRVFFPGRVAGASAAGQGGESMDMASLIKEEHREVQDELMALNERHRQDAIAYRRRMQAEDDGEHPR